MMEARRRRRSVQRRDDAIRSSSTIRSCTASSCRRASSRPSIARPSSTTCPRSTDFASSARNGNRSASRSRRKASAISSRSSARGSRIPICAGAASRRRLQLSQSTNSKVVIIGGGKDGLPIILGNVDNPAPAHARGAPPFEDEALARARMTAATPPVPFERMPASSLATPAEKMPPTDAGDAAGKQAGCRRGDPVRWEAGRAAPVGSAQLVGYRSLHIPGFPLDGTEGGAGRRAAARRVDRWAGAYRIDRGATADGRRRGSGRGAATVIVRGVGVERREETDEHDRTCSAGRAAAGHSGLRLVVFVEP